MWVKLELTPISLVFNTNKFQNVSTNKPSKDLMYDKDLSINRHCNRGCNSLPSKGLMNSFSTVLTSNNSCNQVATNNPSLNEVLTNNNGEGMLIMVKINPNGSRTCTNKVGMLRWLITNDILLLIIVNYHFLLCCNF